MRFRSVLGLADGKVIRIGEDLLNVWSLLQEAVERDVWLELHREDGTVVGINPDNVTYIKCIEETSDSISQ